MRVLKAALIFFAFGLGHAKADGVFSYSHMQPSPFTLSAGQLVYGTHLAYGITDFLQVSTDVVRDIFKFFNASAKVSLLDFPEFALSPTFGFETYNLRDIQDSNPDLRVTSWQPGLVAAVSLIPDTVAVITGGRLNFTNQRLVTGGIEKSGFLRGASFGADLSFLYNPPQAEKKGGPKRGGNAFSSGFTYDVNYKLFGFGISHHWPGFQLGIHYYPAADKQSLLPIIAGGGSIAL